ncbi:hypothetical protein OHB01_11600 [Microbispora hainanensis]|uniref:DUF2199 domain-containing protein n=1 Tax=Microbispora hainanensis TaxID=568844 RepID=A0ABZ1SKP1_9ACTN|nr:MULTISPECIES: hypothetical protein [Microbispora]NJP27832.1 hypothetical protein [Microbispora sp. CL1-1]TQS10599.1 hypothetical protein FLW53_27205 [Microbispora sp. SCL1-1]
METVPTEVALGSIREVPFGELIIALYASDMPDAGPAPEDLPVGQLVGWAVQGIARLGEVEVWHRDYRMRRRQIDSCEVFGNATREQYAADLALRLDEAMEQIGIDREPPFGWVWVLPDGEDFAWQQWMSLRDVEFCFRLCGHSPQEARRRLAEVTQ